MTPDAIAETLRGDCRIRTADYWLTPLTDGDIDDLFRHFADPEVTAYLDLAPIEARFQTWDVIDWAAAVRADGTGVRWTIRDADGAFVGTCGFHLLTYLRARRGEIGYDLARSRWGRGVMAQVMPAVLKFGFDVLDLRRIEAMVTPGNERSMRLLERHGFAREGVLRDYGFWRDRFWDQVLFSRLRDGV